MSYKLGLVAPVRTYPQTYNLGVRVGGAGILGTAMFADLKGEVRSLNQEIQGFTRELTETQSSLPIGEARNKLVAFINLAWTPFLRAWNGYATEHSHWYNNMWMSSWHEVLDYRERYGKLYQAAKEFFAPVTPAPAPVEPDAFQQLAAAPKVVLHEVLKTVVIVAVVALGIYLVINYLPAKGAAATVGSKL